MAEARPLLSVSGRSAPVLGHLQVQGMYLFLHMPVMKKRYWALCGAGGGLSHGRALLGKRLGNGGPMEWVGMEGFVSEEGLFALLVCYEGLVTGKVMRISRGGDKGRTGRCLI